MLTESGLAVPAGRRRLHGLALRAPAVARDARAEFDAAGWSAPVLDEVVAIVDARSAALAGITR